MYYLDGCLGLILCTHINHIYMFAIGAKIGVLNAMVQQQLVFLKFDFPPFVCAQWHWLCLTRKYLQNHLYK